MKTPKSLTLCMCMLLMLSQLSAQQKTATLSGYIRSAGSGEELINATLFVSELSSGAISNVYGFYSMTLPLGTYEITYSYLGYKDETLRVHLTSNRRLDIELSESGTMIEEVVVVAEETNHNIQSVNMSSETMKVEAIKKMPALMGEVDIIKAIQLLPGVKSIGEGTSGFYVRGGNADQNLVLLDEAPIYNASHVLGFFSAFNPDAIKDMQLYKGAMPARYGGRLSSVLDIRMKEGNSKRFAGTAGIGSLMTRLSLEAPLSEHGSFVLSGRRSYIDVLTRPFIKGTENDFTFYFYDLNAKGNYRLNENNRLYVSGYFGRDVLVVPQDDVDVRWGNKTGTMRWNHIFSPKVFSNITTYYSNYDYRLAVKDLDQQFRWDARLQEISLKADVGVYVNPQNTIEFGLQAIGHDIDPGRILVTDGENQNTEVKIQTAQSIESAIYTSHTFEPNPRLKFAIGLRASALNNIGPHTHFSTGASTGMDSTVYGSGSYNQHFNLEPRFAANFRFGENQSLKASYNRTAQYIQQASNGNTATPFDVWFTSSPEVKPQLADQWAMGYFRNFHQDMFEASIEVYYKRFKDAIDFREGAVLLLNKNLEGELRFGRARGYGVELMVRKNVGRLSGWFNYTYSKIEKQINEINSGEWYNAKYDKPHDLSLVLAYDINSRISVSTNFVYSSGGAVTFPTGKYEYYGTVVPVFSERNGARLPDYHRMDFSVTLQSRKNERRRLKQEWVLSIYNAYHRKNAFAINFKQDELNPGRTYAEKSSIFGIVPALTTNIKF